MKILQIILLVLVVIGVVGLGLWWQFGNGPQETDLIRLDTPHTNQIIESPLTIGGEARGYWFFEATFPVVLVDWDGKIIAEHYAEAKGDWMTENFVPFEATLQFQSPYKEGDADFMKKGTLILKKDNPSGLPENDDALEVPVLFKKVNKSDNTGIR